MTNKIKLLLWSFLTILFVWLSTTYAYNLWDNAWQESRDEIIKNVCFKNLRFSYNDYQDWKCPAWQFYIPHGPFPSWFFLYTPNPFPHLFFLNIQGNGEWFIFRRSIWKNWGLSIKDFSFPSKAWFQYIDPKGKKSILTKVYYWHNTAYFFDPDTMHWFSFIGDRALWNLFLVANPFKDENNLYLINFHNKTAYSKTVDPKIALQYMLGDPQYIDKIKEVKWETSYTLVPWGNEVLPPNFDTPSNNWNWKLWVQGESKGWNYVEDLTVKSPNWYEWSNKSNAENTGNTVAKNITREEKKSCVAYYTYMRSMSSHSDWCLWEVNKDMSDTRLDYWWAISTDWDLSKFWVWDKTKYRRCWHWNNYKEGVKKTLWDKWPAFWKDWQTNYIATEAKDIDVNALCSHIVVWSQMNSWGLTFDNFSKAIEWTLLSRGDTVWTLNWISVPKNVFERDYALMMRYEIACKDKVRLPTEYDNTFSDLLLFKTFWDDNNKNVCKKAEELKEKFKEKYKDLIFTKNYEKAFKSDFGEDSVSSSWTVVIEKALSWSIDKALKVKSLSGLWEKTAWALVDYFTKDYTDWYNKGFSLLGWKGCGVWIWVKEWDYIMRLFLFMILIWLVWKS